MNNKYFKSVISFLLVVSILFSFSFAFTSFAASQKGIINKDLIRVRTSPTTTTSSNILKHNNLNILLNTGDEVTVIETVNSPDDKQYPTWCHIKFVYDNKNFEGYVYSGFVDIDDTPEDNTPGGIMPDGVPEIYESYIQKLVDKHPNWKFVFYDTKINWNDLLTEDAQCFVGRSLIQYTYPVSYRSTQSGAYNWRTDTWYSLDGGGWYQANKETIAYYLDPRNFLNEKYIFMFESLRYNEAAHDVDSIESMLNGSFMSNVEIAKSETENVKYSQAYLDAAIASSASPFHLVTRTIQEVGRKGSGSTSGTYEGYEGYYNFYNIGAYSGSNPIANGLKYASGQSASASDIKKYGLPWDSQYKAIVGGAKWIAEGYINKNQDTLYYQKFNVVNKVWTHQYMTNIMAPQSESANIYKSYSNLNILNQPYTFIIPYYRNMPVSACQLPENNDYSPNNWLKELNVKGCTFEFDGGKTDGYKVTVPANTVNVNISAKTVNSKATVSGVGELKLVDGSNVFKIVVTAQNGDKRTYTIEIVKSTENKIPLKEISLNKTEISMFNGDTQTLNVTFNPSNTTDSKVVSWSSSDTSVATVKDGQVVAIGKGTATITAKVGSFTATCKVTVSNKILKGDIDADGAVTISDALLIFKYKSGEIKLSDTALKAADVNGNGAVDLTDALRIFKYKNGEIDSL